MEPVTVDKLQFYLERLSERLEGRGVLYLLGGSALALLGSPRTTVDLDYSLGSASESPGQLEADIAELAEEMHIDAESVPIGEFVPLPPGAYERRQLVRRYGQLDVYVFDPYTIALSKIARGFDADFEDVLFLLHRGFIKWNELEQHFESVLPKAKEADIIPSEFREYMDELRRRWRDMAR